MYFSLSCVLFLELYILLSANKGKISNMPKLPRYNKMHGNAVHVLESMLFLFLTAVHCGKECEGGPRMPGAWRDPGVCWWCRIPAVRDPGRGAHVYKMSQVHRCWTKSLCSLYNLWIQTLANMNYPFYLAVVA